MVPNEGGGLSGGTKPFHNSQNPNGEQQKKRYTEHNKGSLQCLVTGRKRLMASLGPQPPSDVFELF